MSEDRVLAELERLNDSLSGEIRRMDERLEDVRADIAAVRAELGKVHVDVARLQEQVTEKRPRVDKLEERVTAAEKTIAEAKGVSRPIRWLLVTCLAALIAACAAVVVRR